MNRNSLQFTYSWASYDQLTKAELYQLLQLRQQVFIVEQNCAYLDADGLDQLSRHLLCYGNSDGKRVLLGCLRIIEPGGKHREPTIGRLLCAESVRGHGVGREMTRRALIYADHHWPGQSVKISAQLYLKNFYERLDFAAVSEPYDEDGIPHIEMVCSPVSTTND